MDEKPMSIDEWYKYNPYVFEKKKDQKQASNASVKKELPNYSYPSYVCALEIDGNECKKRGDEQ